MVKRLIIVLFAISMVAMIWPAASAQGCGWVQGKDPNNPSRWCYWCDGPDQYCDGRLIETGYCAAWWGGSAVNGVEGKFAPKNCAKNEDGTTDDCLAIVSAISGSGDTSGSSLSTSCDNAYNKWDETLDIHVIEDNCPPGHTKDPENDCTLKVDPSGVPGTGPSLVSASGLVKDALKKNFRERVELYFEHACPNKNWDCNTIPFIGNFLTCVSWNGVKKVGDIYEACAERNDQGACIAPSVGTTYYGGGVTSTDYWEYKVLHCQDIDFAENYMHGDTVAFYNDNAGTVKCVDVSECTPTSGDSFGEICQRLYNASRGISY